MENIPQADLIEHERQRALAARDSLTPLGANDNDSDNDSQDDSSSEQPSSKRSIICIFIYYILSAINWFMLSAISLFR